MTEKIALCFIISGAHILNKEDVWKEWIEHNKDIINVYFHYSDFSLIQSEWIRSKSLPPSNVVKTSYYQVVPAYLTLISFAASHDPNNKWFCFLTDSCAPAISPQQFKSNFFLYSEKSVIKWSTAWWNPQLHKRANLKYLPTEMHLLNDPWFVLTKHDALLCLQFATKHKQLYMKICVGGIANESIFAIILKWYNRLQLVINAETTITNWNKMTSSTSPYVFKRASLEDIQYILKEKEKKQSAMFVRKIDTTFPDDILRRIIYN